MQDKFKKLEQLFQKGILTQEEFEREKQRILGNYSPQNIDTILDSPEILYDKQQNSTYTVVLHLILFVPFIGWLISLLMWFFKKNESPLVRQHGISLVNMMLSSIIYVIILVILVIILTTLGLDNSAAFNGLLDGFYMIISFTYLIITCVFIILNALKAYKGQSARYPLSFRILLNADLPKQENNIEDHLIN